MTKMGIKYKVKLLLGMLLMSGLSLVEQLSFSETGKYCAPLFAVLIRSPSRL